MTSLTLTDANVRSPTYYVARTSAPCRRCGSPTGLLAVALPSAHETLEDGPPDTWQRADADALLFYIERLSDEVRHRLHDLSPCFHVAENAVTPTAYWANHCEHCGELLDDHELHCEPGGAFAPSSEAAAAEIELLAIDEPFAAAASGYALEPEFFRSMREI